MFNKIVWWVREIIRFRRVFGYWPIPTQANKERAERLVTQLHRESDWACERLVADQERFPRLTEAQAVIRVRLLDECEERRNRALGAEQLMTSLEMDLPDAQWLFLVPIQINEAGMSREEELVTSA